MPRPLPKRVRQLAGDHVDLLAKHYRIKVRVWDRLDSVEGMSRGEAHPATRQTWGPEIVTAYDYLVHLHEIGHVVSKPARAVARRKEYGVDAQLAEEGAAWGWAFAHALPEVLRYLTKREWRWVHDALHSYMVDAALAAPPRHLRPAA